MFCAIYLQERINNTKLTKFVKTVGQNFFYTKYNIRIQAYNPMGVGPMSPTVDIMSAEDRMFLFAGL